MSPACTITSLSANGPATALSHAVTLPCVSLKTPRSMKGQPPRIKCPPTCGRRQQPSLSVPRYLRSLRDFSAQPEYFSCPKTSVIKNLGRLSIVRFAVRTLHFAVSAIKDYTALRPVILVNRDSPGPNRGLHEPRQRYGNRYRRWGTYQLAGMLPPAPVSFTSSIPLPVPRLREYCLSCGLFQCSWTPRLFRRTSFPLWLGS